MPLPDSPHERFQQLDSYRVEREWLRYSGTAQRELFRRLRERFLARHRGAPGWVADLGSGPGRFTDQLGPRDAPRVLLDLSEVALRASGSRARTLRRSPARWHPVVGDAARPPLRTGAFGTVALLGNVVGFSEGSWETVLDAGAGLLPNGGKLLVEAVAGPGEASVYLSRLPVGALTRALVAPANWVVGRIEADGFRKLSAREKSGAARFRRLAAATLAQAITQRGFRVEEILVVAPGLGSAPDRLESIHADPNAWQRLIALEEQIGASEPRRARAAAYLIAATREGEFGPRTPPIGPSAPASPPP